MTERMIVFYRYFNHESLSERKYLLEPGEVCKYERFITRGCVCAYTVDNTGFEYALCLLLNIGGVWPLWFPYLHPVQLIIDALVDTGLLQISKHNLERLYEWKW